MIVKRGEIWYAELNPIRGSEQAGARPVLVVQNDVVNQFTTTVLAIPLTTNLRRAALPSCVQVAAGEGGLTADSVLLCHQLRALDKSRLRDKLGEVSEETMISIETCILFTLGISLGE
jgi:mRNA interferase MazF